jgi:hypothetical protein
MLSLSLSLLLAVISTRAREVIGPVVDLPIVNAEISPDGYPRK